jgi:Ribose/xylose/arabinose/galactoside ABC-type transport systems, permease components
MKGKKIAKQYSKLIILLAFVVVLSILKPKSFPTVGNISNVLWSISVVGILTAGTIFTLLLGGIDLSVGSMMGLSACITVLMIQRFEYSEKGVVIGILLALMVGILGGLFHGIVVTIFKVPAFLVTFATQSVFLGISQIITDNKIIACLKPELFTKIGLGRVGPFTIPIYLMLFIVLISFFMLNKTVFGRFVYIVGGNKEAAKLSGINEKMISIICYVFSGFTAAIGGIVLSSMTQQGMASTGGGYETDIITAAVVGGVSLVGGEGKIQDALVGAILVGLLNNGMNLVGVPSTHQGLIKGLVIIVAVALDVRQKSEGSVSIFSFKKGKKVL